MATIHFALKNGEVLCGTVGCAHGTPHVSTSFPSIAMHWATVMGDELCKICAQKLFDGERFMIDFDMFLHDRAAWLRAWSSV